MKIQGWYRTKWQHIISNNRDYKDSKLRTCTILLCKWSTLKDQVCQKVQQKYIVPNTTNQWHQHLATASYDNIFDKEIYLLLKIYISDKEIYLSLKKLYIWQGNPIEISKTEIKCTQIRMLRGKRNFQRSGAVWESLNWLDNNAVKQELSGGSKLELQWNR